MTAIEFSTGVLKADQRGRRVEALLIPVSEFDGLRKQLSKAFSESLLKMIDDEDRYLTPAQVTLKNKLGNWTGSFVFRGVLVLTGPEVTAPLFL